MIDWISVDDQLPNYKEEVHVLILLKEDYDWFPKSYAQRVDKAWWLPQRESVLSLKMLRMLNI